MTAVRRVFGTASFVSESSRGFRNPQDVGQVLDLLVKHGIDKLDTARRYGDGRSEELLGNVRDKIIESFTVDTKASPRISKMDRDGLFSQCDASLRALHGIPIDVFYIHAPDRSVPLAETAAAINDLYKRGTFKRFGLSNFSAEEVSEMHEICKRNSYILPTVYQGNYNAVTRNNEDELFPALRKLGISFYAYSPLAGGLLAKTPDQLKNPVQGSRFDPNTYAGKLYCNWYMQTEFLDALDEFQRLCKEQNVRPAQAALSWLLYHSKLQSGDAIILGASAISQLEENLEDSEAGELSGEIVSAMGEMWGSVKAKAPAYHF